KFYLATREAWPGYHVEFPDSDQCEQIYRNPPLNDKQSRRERIEETRDRIRVAHSELLPGLMVATEISPQTDGNQEALVAKIMVPTKKNAFEFYRLNSIDLKRAEGLMDKQISDKLKSQWVSIIKWINETRRGPQ